MNLILSIVLAVLVGASCLLGILDAGTYAREVPAYAAQGMGQDVVTLGLVVPLLLVTAFFAQRSRTALLLWSGALFYLAYTYLIYAVGVHFNQLFLLYCAILGLAFYLLAFHLRRNPALLVEDWFGSRTPVRTVGIFLIALGGLFYFIWLSEDITAIVNNATPATVGDLGLMTNPVHVMDLAIALPALIMAGIMLMRRRPLGFLLAPMLLVFGIIMAIAIAAMIVAMHLLNSANDTSSIGVFGLIILAGLVVLILFLRGLRKTKREAA